MLGGSLADGGAGLQRTVPTPLHVSAIYFDGKFVAADQFYNNNTNVQVQE